jgi:hypothetical protein
MRGEIVVDPVSGLEYVISWDGSRGQTLQDYDTNSTRQRPGAKEYMTSGATLTLDLRRGGSVHKGSV